MAGLREYAGDFLRRSREALEAGFIHLASTCPVTWRCWMRHVSLHPSSFDLPPWLRTRSNGHRRMPRQSRLRPSPRSRQKICRRAMGEEGGESFDHLVSEGEHQLFHFAIPVLGVQSAANDCLRGHLGFHRLIEIFVRGATVSVQRTITIRAIAAGTANPHGLAGALR
jgi:hypothetical protein